MTLIIGSYFSKSLANAQNKPECLCGFYFFMQKSMHFPKTYNEIQKNSAA